MQRSLLTFLILLLASFASSCSTLKFEQPDISLVDLNVDKVALFETTLKVAVRVKNENSFPLYLRGASHRVSVSGEYIGSGASDATVEIPAFGSSIQEVDVHLSNLSILSRINPLIKSKRFDYELASKLDIGTSDYGMTKTVKVSQQGKYGA